MSHMSQLNLRKVPEDLVRQLKARAAAEGRTMHDVALHYIQIGLDQGFPSKSVEKRVRAQRGRRPATDPGKGREPLFKKPGKLI